VSGDADIDFFGVVTGLEVADIGSRQDGANNSVRSKKENGYANAVLDVDGCGA
jgi:hypothetical protein